MVTAIAIIDAVDKYKGIDTLYMVSFMGADDSYRIAGTGLSKRHRPLGILYIIVHQLYAL